MALSDFMVGRQHEVAIAFEAKCVAPSESPDLPKSERAKFRVRIEQERCGAAVRVDEHKPAGFGAGVPRADQASTGRLATHEKIVGRQQTSGWRPPGPPSIEAKLAPAPPFPPQVKNIAVVRP